MVAMQVIGPRLQRSADCEAVLRSLPQWFGIEASMLAYARDTATLPTFAVVHEQRIVAFVSLREHFPAAWEVHCLAVSAGVRGTGIGTHLLTHAERWLAGQGVKFLQIKTIAAARADSNYAQTRAFYAARGYTSLEVFPTLWSPTNPVLQLVKALHPSGSIA